MNARMHPGSSTPLHPMHSLGPNEASTLDPQARNLLEQTHISFVDASNKTQKSTARETGV